MYFTSKYYSSIHFLILLLLLCLPVWNNCTPKGIECVDSMPKYISTVNDNVKASRFKDSRLHKFIEGKRKILVNISEVKYVQRKANITKYANF